jgi:rSAM/selenodomain-associated transferase 1
LVAPQAADRVVKESLRGLEFIAMNRNPHLLVFLKYPEPGRVKTRLAATIGDLEAARLYANWVTITLERVQALRGEIHIVCYYDGAPPEAFGRWRTLADEWWSQPQGDLGSRLESGFGRAFARGARSCLAIGTDCLEMEADDIEMAIAALSSCNAVFGPAEDGGYYLVGTASILADFFTNVRWSANTTLSDHLQRCRENGWSYQLLATRRDIDSGEDLDWHQGRQPEVSMKPRPT